MKFGIFLPISVYGYMRLFLWQNKLIFDTINWTTRVILKKISYLQIAYFFLLHQMMSPIVSFCRELSLNLFSTLYLAWKYLLRTIYAQRTIGLDSDPLRDLVQFAQFKKLEKHPWWSVVVGKAAC